MRGKYVQRTCPSCSGPMSPRVRTTGIKETPREFARRKKCDVCSPPKAKPRIHQVTLRDVRQQDANQVLQQWR